MINRTFLPSQLSVERNNHDGNDVLDVALVDELLTVQAERGIVVDVADNNVDVVTAADVRRRDRPLNMSVIDAARFVCNGPILANEDEQGVGG